MALRPAIGRLITRLCSVAPSRMEAIIICSGLLAAHVPMLVVVLAQEFGASQTRSNLRDLGGFYVGATILNSGQPEALYDLDFQGRVLRNVYPGALPTQRLPYVYAPIFAFGLRPFAALPFEWASLAWAMLSAGLYVTGVLLLLPRRLPDGYRSVALLASLAFAPFLVETLIAGQVTAVAFFLVALALRFERAGLRFLAGVALGLGAYRPHLLMPFVVMAAVGREFAIVAGFIVGAAAMAAASIGATNWPTFVNWIHALTSFGSRATDFAELPPWWPGFIDLYHSLHVLPGGGSWPAKVECAVAAACATAWLASVWWRSKTLPRPRRDLLIAATLSWSLLLNVFVVVYDSMLLTLGLFLTADALYALGPRATQKLPTLRMLAMLILAVSFVSRPFAHATGVQLATLAILALAVFQLRAVKDPPSEAGVTRVATPQEQSAG